MRSHSRWWLPCRGKTNMGSGNLLTQILPASSSHLYPSIHTSLPLSPPTATVTLIAYTDLSFNAINLGKEQTTPIGQWFCVSPSLHLCLTFIAIFTAGPPHHRRIEKKSLFGSPDISSTRTETPPILNIMGSRGNIVQPEGSPRSWCRDNLFLTTEKTFLDPKAVNDVFESDLMWWNDPLELSQMRKMLDNCLTLALYSVPDSEEDMKSELSHHIPPRMQNQVFLYRRTCLTSYCVTQNRQRRQAPTHEWPRIQTDRPGPYCHRLRHLCVPHRRLHHRGIPTSRPCLMDDACSERTCRRVAESAWAHAYDS